jgi:hypothetical protein
MIVARAQPGITLQRHSTRKIAERESESEGEGELKKQREWRAWGSGVLKEELGMG